MKLIKLRKRFLGTLVALGLAAMLIGCAGNSDSDSGSGGDDFSNDPDCGCDRDDVECQAECADQIFN
jgi:hypothetical protein